MKTSFLREIGVDSNFKGDAASVEFEASDKEAHVVHVSMRRDLQDDGSLLREYVCLTMKDRGSIAKPCLLKHAVIVRRQNDLVPLPDGAGKFLGFVQSNSTGDQFYVFASRDVPLAIGSTSEETTSPLPAKAPASAASLEHETPCPCVVAGPSTHEPAASPSSQKASEEEPPSWWEFQDAPQASGG